jgi:predicted house-cleaning noncanonical NTP pyrophosphatase (MazG superfamily)
VKLVRDGIPAKVAAQGEREPFRPVVDHAEHVRLLDAKLDEELGEWRAASDPEELADLLEAVRCLAAAKGIGWRGLLDLADHKRALYGDYSGGVVWLGGGAA